MVYGRNVAQRHVGSWPLADVQKLGIDVCFRGRSGHHKLAPSRPFLTRSGHRRAAQHSALFAVDSLTKLTPSMIVGSISRFEITSRHFHRTCFAVPSRQSRRKGSRQRITSKQGSIAVTISRRKWLIAAVGAIVASPAIAGEGGGSKYLQGTYGDFPKASGVSHGRAPKLADHRGLVR